MTTMAILERIDGTQIVTDKVIAQRKFVNNQIVHLGTTYEIIKMIRPDLSDEGSTDVKVRLIVKEAPPGP